jgi:hypothetical protein
MPTIAQWKQYLKAAGCTVEDMQDLSPLMWPRTVAELDEEIAAATRPRVRDRIGLQMVGGAGALTGQGVTRDSLKPGDVVVITGNPGRNAVDHRIRMRTLLRPADGFGWGQRGETFD